MAPAQDREGWAASGRASGTTRSAGRRLLGGLGILAVALAFFLLRAPVASAGGPWYVDPAGDDGNTCLSPGPSNACKTVGGAPGKRQMT